MGKYSVIRSMKKEDNILTVELFGALSIETSDEFHNQIKGKLDGVDKLVLNMKNLSYITSVGVQVLFLAAKALAEHGGKVIAKSVNDDVKAIFDLLNVSYLIDIED